MFDLTRLKRLATAGLLAVLSLLLSAQPGPFRPFALPSSRSTHVIFNRFMTLPPFTARVPEAGQWVFAPSLELSQNMVNAWLVQDDSRELRSYFDYEVLAFELPVEVGLGDGWLAGIDAQFNFYSGGLLDGTIQAFHGLFGFPNNSRELIPDGRILIDMDPVNQPGFHAATPVAALADPVAFVGWGGYPAPRLGMSLLGLLAIPLGLGEGLAGTTSVQFGLALAADWWPADWLSVHAQLGGVLPAESLAGAGPLPMLQARLSLVGNLDFPWLPYLDFRLHSSPVLGGILVDGQDYFNLPNSDIHFGLLFCPEPARGAGSHTGFAVQEDPFSHNGADVGFQSASALATPAR
jgi:hypothetical protein